MINTKRDIIRFILYDFELNGSIILMVNILNALIIDHTLSQKRNFEPNIFRAGR